MNARSKTSVPTISRDLFSAISLRELGSGALLCVWPDGRITERYGREVAPASLSPRLAKALGLMMSGTYGPPSNGSSKSVDLSPSLASKLRARTDCIGSILYRLTWKARATPSGRSIPALRGSPLRISGNVSTGWVTPSARDWKDTEKAIARVAGPHANDLRDFVQMAGWPSPTAADVHRGDYSRDKGDPSKPRPSTTGIAKTVEFRFIPSIIGQTPTGCSVVIPTDRASGPLNPAHSLWLMLGAFATDWLRCAERVTLSTSRKRKPSAKSQSK